MARTRPGLLTRRHASGEEQIPLRGEIITLGRSESCTVVVQHPTVSRLHARIELQHDRYMLWDTGSANGTFVNGQRLNAGHQLATGDEIWLGSRDTALTFSDPEETQVVTFDAPPPPLLIDEQARAVQAHGVDVALSPLEYGLLLYLAQHPGTVCTREACFLHVWGQPYDHATCEDALNACVAKLRRNLRQAAQQTGNEPPQITTILRVGFRLDGEVSFAQYHEARNS